MPLYEYECPKCGRFEEFRPVTEMSVRCSCGKPAKKLISLPSMVIGIDGFEENNRKAKNPDALHEARMENKRKVEEKWGDVESGRAEYDPGKTPEAYQPRQHLARSKKRLH